MRWIILLLLAASVTAQNPNAGGSQHQTRCNSADLLYRPVVHEMWAQDERDYANASGFIRIAVHPTWSPEFFADVQLNRKGAPTVVLYSLPKNVKTATVLLEKELEQHPGADAKSLAKMLPVQRHTLQADKKIEDLIAEFFTLRFAPRPIRADFVRLDATEYELEYIGDDTILFSTDDHETPVVKWIDSLLSAAHDASPR